MRRFIGASDRLGINMHTRWTPTGIGTRFADPNRGRHVVIIVVGELNEVLVADKRHTAVVPTHMQQPGLLDKRRQPAHMPRIVGRSVEQLVYTRKEIVPRSGAIVALGPDSESAFLGRWE